ncbi:MAG: hypothetical protein ACLPZM_03630 [Thermoplasmata archaeon]
MDGTKRMETIAPASGPRIIPDLGPLGPGTISVGPPGTRRLAGSPLTLTAFPAETITNRQFQGVDLAHWDRFFLPPALTPLVDEPGREVLEAIEDDNRSALLPDPVATLDGLPFYLSVKGIGSSVAPFSHQRLDAGSAAELTEDLDVRQRLRRRSGDVGGGIISGELWLRGSPYGGQGLPHALTALRVSERADLTSLGGFRIAPVVKVSFLPESVADRLRGIHWYRKYRDRFVQELRLVPSNVRVYFHARRTVGNDPGAVFDQFGLDTAAKAHAFELNLVRSGVAVLTLFARTAAKDPAGRRYVGLDFEDVWLDKDAVIAPEGTIFFVDLEGIEPVAVEPEALREKVEDQIFRSLYEFMFAFEQVEAERARRFGSVGSRKRYFETLVVDSLRTDPFVRPRRGPTGLQLQVLPGREKSLSFDFPLVDT